MLQDTESSVTSNEYLRLLYTYREADESVCSEEFCETIGLIDQL